MKKTEIKNNEQKLTTKELVVNYFDAFKNGNIDFILDLVADDATWHIDGNPLVSTVGLWKGKENIKYWLKNFPNYFKAREFCINKILCDENSALVSGRFRHLILPTSNTIGSDMAIHFDFNSEKKIKRYQIYEDTDLLYKSFSNDYKYNNHEIKINKTVYRYTDIGEGPVLIFLHGLLLDRTIFNKSISELSGSYRCINFDLPAHGLSNFNPQGWSLETIADDLAIFIREMSLEEVTIVGHSQGANIGLYLAEKYPDLMKNMVLLGANANKEEDESKLKFWKELHDNIHNNNKELILNSLKEYLTNIYKLSSLSESEKDEAVLNKFNRIITIDSQAVAMAIRIAVLEKEDLTHLLSKISCHTEIIHGAEDQVMPVSTSKYINERIGDSNITILSGASHSIPLEKPKFLANLILETVK